MSVDFSMCVKLKLPKKSLIIILVSVTKFLVRPKGIFFSIQISDASWNTPYHFVTSVIATVRDWGDVFKHVWPFTDYSNIQPQCMQGLIHGVWGVTPTGRIRSRCPRDSKSIEN